MTQMQYLSLIHISLIGNGFNILNVNPFFKDLTTGIIIVIAVALAASGARRR